MAQPPLLNKHIPSLDQKFDEIDSILQFEPQSNLQPPHYLNNAKFDNHEISQPSPPPAPLIDLVALITPKQNQNSKKWSVGASYTSTSIIFEYLESARLAIQNDGRLFIPPSKKTLSATHSSLSSSNTSIPRISHISVPRTIYFSNNAVVRINREWHIGELLPIMYTANINPPTVSSTAKNDYNHAVTQLQHDMLLFEKPLSTGADTDDDDDDEDEEHDDDDNDDDTEQIHVQQPILPSKQSFTAPSRSYLSIWSRGGFSNDQLININTTNNTGSNKNEIAIKKIIHDHNHNHNFFWSHYYDHNTSLYNKPEDDGKNENEDENKDDTDTYTNFLKYLRENEDENANYDIKTQTSLIKMDLVNAINNNNSSQNNPATTANYKYVDISTQFRYSDKNIYGENMIHRPLAITHGNNIVFLLFPDGNIWSAYHNHLLQPDPFQPNSEKVFGSTLKNPMSSIDSTMIQSVIKQQSDDNKQEEEILISPSSESQLSGNNNNNNNNITPFAKTADHQFMFQSKAKSVNVMNQSVELKESNEDQGDIETNDNEEEEEEKISQQSPLKYTKAKKQKEIKTEKDYVKKTLNKPFKTRPLVIGDWRIGEGEHRWFLIKYVPNLRDIHMMNTSNDEEKGGKNGGDDMYSASIENSKLDWELSEEDSRSKLVFMISPAGRIWSCCSGGCWFNAGEYDKTFNDKYERFNDKQHKIVSTPLPFCRSGLTLIPEASYIRPNINYYDEPAMKERDLIIRQLRCLAMPNEIVPLKISEHQADKLRGSYSNIVYGVDGKQKYFVHYNCIYLWDLWTINNDIYSDRTEQVDGYAPYALFIVTRYPFHNSFARILDNFLLIKDKNAVSNDQFVENLHEVLSQSFNRIGPIIDNNKYNDDLNEEVIMISCPNGDTVMFENNGHYLPIPINSKFYTPSLHSDINWGVLFRVLEPMNVLTVITAILQEKKIILLSNHPSLLFPCCEVLLCLIYPFQWIHFYRPFISPCDPYINQYLKFTKPAIFGLLSSSITKLPNNFNGMIIRLDSNTIELHNITLSVLPSKLTLWLFASIIQNADFYLHHRPEQESFIKVPSQIDKRQIHAIRSPQFRTQYMNTTNSNNPTASSQPSSPRQQTQRTSFSMSGRRLLRHHMTPTGTPTNYSIPKSETSTGATNNNNQRSFDLSQSLPLNTKSNNEYNFNMKTPKTQILNVSINSDTSFASNEEIKNDDNRPQSARHSKEYKEEIFIPSDSFFKEETASNTTSEVVVDGQEIISIVDRVLLSNFSLNHSSSLIHEHLTDYTQTPLKPDPLPEIRDAPPDEAWIESTVFRKYQYYHAHMNGSKQTLLSGPSLRSPNSTSVSSPQSNGSMNNNNNNNNNNEENINTYDFTVTHQMIVPSTSDQNTPNIKPNKISTTSDVGQIGPLMSATSMASAMSAADSIPIPSTYINNIDNTADITSKTYVNRSYTFTKSFIGLGVINGSLINVSDRESQANTSGVLNWLFASGRAESTESRKDNKSKSRSKNKYKNKNKNKHKYKDKHDIGDLNININLLRNHFMRAFASLLCGFWKYIVPVKYSSTTTVEFDSHGFLGSRQEFNYNKMVYQNGVNNHNSSLIINQSSIDNKVNMFLDEYLPSIIDSATIIADNFESTDFNDNTHSFNNDDLNIKIDNEPILNNNNNNNKKPILNRKYRYSSIDGFDHYEPSVPPPKDELSSLILSQFLDRLLSTLLWTHLITHWHYNDNLNNNSIIHPNTSNNFVLPTNIYFTYFDIAMKAYKIDRKKLRELRSDILCSGLSTVHNAIMFKDTSYLHNRKRKSIVVVRKPKEKKHELHCGFEKPWNIRFCRDTAESVEDLQNIFRENAHMIVVNVSWNYRIGAVIGYQQSKLLFESWFASFIRRLKELTDDQCHNINLHHFEPDEDDILFDDNDNNDKLSDVVEEEKNNNTPSDDEKTHFVSKSKHHRYATEPASTFNTNNNNTKQRPLLQSKSDGGGNKKNRHKHSRKKSSKDNNNNNKKTKEGLLSLIGIQIFVRDPRSLKSVVETLKRRRDRDDLGGLHPQRIWISAHMLNATQPTAIAKELIISPSKFFQYVDIIPDFTICLSWCTRGGGAFTRHHMEEMKKIVDQFIFKKKIIDQSNNNDKNKHLIPKHPKLMKTKTVDDIKDIKKKKENNNKRNRGFSTELNGNNIDNDIKLMKKSTKQTKPRSFCFYVRASHLFVGDGWKYLHQMLMDRFPTSCVVFTAREEGISITNFKWLSAHFPTNRSFYTFENRDIQNDISHLDLLHHVVEATKSPLWFGDLKQHRKKIGIIPSKTDNNNNNNNNISFQNEEDKLIYYDGGVLSSEWRTGRFLERSKVYFYNHRFAIVNRGWILSKHELYPPWKMNGRALITGYTQLHILFRTPGAIHKPTSHGNVAYGIRATITTKGEFALETVRLDGQSKKIKSKIDLRNNINMNMNNNNNSNNNEYKNYKHTSSTGFIFPQSTSASAMHTMAFSFELIDYGALYPIEFSIQQLNVNNGYPISRKQTIKMQVSYPKNDIKCPWYHYVVFNSHQNAMWPILVDRLVINQNNILIPIKNKHLLLQKKTFKKKHFGGGISQRNIGDML